MCSHVECILSNFHPWVSQEGEDKYIKIENKQDLTCTLKAFCGISITTLISIEFVGYLGP